MIRLLIVAVTLCFLLGNNALAQTKVIYNVDGIAQPSQMSCWAAATTMIVNWKSGIKRPIKDVVALGGPKFVQIYDSSFAQPPLGISPSDEADFYKALGLRVIQKLNPSVDGWAKLLKANGPLSITVDADPGKGYIHALVIIGIDGDGSAANTIVTYIDPNGGKRRDLAFADFLKLYEGSATWPLQIVHNP